MELSPKNLKSWFNPSGGLVYHFRAFAYRKLWRNHCDETELFLEEWNPPRDSLLLLGPSAGYSLPRAWLKSFKHIKAVEPDPIARVIFETRHGIRVEWIKEAIDFREPNALAKIAQGTSAILFCNLLGQLEESLNFARLLARVRDMNREAKIASFHDIFSGHDFRFKRKINVGIWGEKLNEDEIKKQISLNPAQSHLELNEHHPFASILPEMGEVFSYWEWQITPNQTQVIEAVRFRK